MDRIAEYGDLDALGLAELVKSKAVQPLELVEEAILRIEDVNPQLNAVITTMYDRAREVAKSSPDGVFGGVPILMKDLQFACAGVPLSNGSRFLKTYVPAFDALLTQRLVAAGLVIVGKTNTSEFGLAPYTEPEAFGPTRNPWNLDRTPGGSSGGSAAAVAARAVPMASASDGGGSLRVPASCCGLFGLKPSRGRNPTGPGIVDAWFGASVGHVLSRSVRDSAAMLDATSGPEPGAVYFAPPPGRPFLEEVGADLGALRIAVSTTPLLGSTVDTECLNAVGRTVELLEELGHSVDQATPDVDRDGLKRAFVLAVAAETRADIMAGETLVGRKATSADFERETWLLRLFASRFTATDYVNALRVLRAAGPAMARFFDDYDVLLTPTIATPPGLIGSGRSSGAQALVERLCARLNSGALVATLGVLEPIVNRVLDFIPFTPLSNISGQPAISVPLEWSADALPIGLQFVGRFGDEATLIRLAAKLEEARPWANRLPAICARTKA